MSTSCLKIPRTISLTLLLFYITYISRIISEKKSKAIRECLLYQELVNATYKSC